MSRLVGTVTRSMPNTIVESQQTAQGNVAAFAARGADGRNVGFFRNAGSAQKAVASAAGGVILRWTRQDLRGGIEHYVGRTGPSDPLEIYGAGDLVQWSEMDAGITLLPTDPTLVQQAGDRSGQRNNLVSVASAEPQFDPEDAGGLPALLFDGGAKRMTTSLAIAATDSFTVTVAATVSGAAASRVLVQVDGGPAFVLGRAAGGEWRLTNGAGTITGPAPTVNSAQVAQAVQTPTGAELWVDGVLAGSNLGAIGAGSVIISDAASGWLGRLSGIAIALTDDGSKRDLTQRYFMERYNTP